MKKFLIRWGGWFLFFSAVVSVSAEIYNYSVAGFILFRALFVCTVSSLFMTVWWYSMGYRSSDGNVTKKGG